MRLSSPETWAYILGGIFGPMTLIGFAIGNRKLMGFGSNGCILVVGLFYAYVIIGGITLAIWDRWRAPRN